MTETELLKISASSRGLSDEDDEEIELGDVDLDEDDEDGEDDADPKEDGGEPDKDDGLVTEE